MKKIFIIPISLVLLSVAIFVSCSNGNDIPPIPTEPQNVTATASVPGCIDVSWNAVDSAISYVVYYRLSSDDSEEDLQIIETEKTFIRIENLIGDKTYDFWVTAKNSTGESDRSDVVSAKSYFSTPTEPKNMTVTASGFCCMDVSWDAVDSATCYIVYYRLSSDDSEENLNKIETEETYLTIEHLIDEETYDFWVIAKNSSGESDRSDIVSARSYFPAPGGVHAYAQGTGNAYVSWFSVKGADSYEIYAAELDEYFREKEKILCTTGVGVSKVVRLTSRKRYIIYVKAVRGTKKSDYSSGYRYVLIH